MTVEDAEIRKVQGNAFDGLEKVYALLTKQDGTQEKVEMKYRESKDPSPGLGVDSSPKPANVGPHSGEGPRLVATPSGRTVDVYELNIDIDHYKLGYGQKVTFQVETNARPQEPIVLQADPETLWK